MCARERRNAGTHNTTGVRSEAKDSISAMLRRRFHCIVRRRTSSLLIVDVSQFAAASICHFQSAVARTRGASQKKIARLCRIPCINRQPRCSRSRCNVCGLPAARRKSRLNRPINCIQPSLPMCSRSRMGARFCGIAPRLSSRNCRPVQSNRFRYSANDIGRQPLFDTRAAGTGARSIASDSSN